MRSLIILFLLFVIGYLTIVTGGPLVERRIDNIVRVMMHDTAKYTLFLADGDRITATSYQVWDAVLITDVPKGEPMWAMHRRKHFAILSLEIHIHSAADINGGMASLQQQSVVIE